MSSKHLVATLAVLAATAQPAADGIIAVLIGL
jgi:hypothetical protein